MLRKMDKTIKACRRIYGNQSKRRAKRDAVVMIARQQFLIWNNDVEAWEPIAEAGWMECGVPLAAVYRVCSKFIGHEGGRGVRGTSRVW